jgi:hypothetical protein
MTESTIVPAETIASSIIVMRGQKVILDTDLASLYGVETKVFNQAVRRNLDRFPADFMFQLTPDEAGSLRSQFVTSNQRGGRRYTPFAFTEHGAVMAATILNSPRAVEFSVYVVRAFVKLRSIFAAHEELADRLDELEGRVDGHDKSITLLIEAIRQLALPPETSDRKIGFDEGR